MDISTQFFAEACTPKLIYWFDLDGPATDSPFQCVRMNRAAERWIGVNALGHEESQSLDTVFASWGVLDQFRHVINTARSDGRCITSLFARGQTNVVELDAFVIGKNLIGVSMRTDEDMQRTFPLDVFLSVSLDLLCIADSEGRFIRVNDEFSRVLGYEIDDIENRQIVEFVHPEDVSLTRAAASMISDGNPLPHFINRYRTKDGDYRFLQWKSIPYPPYIIASARDITEAFSLSLSLEKEFVTDSLTGAKNRKAFEHEAHRLVNDFSSNAIVSSLIMADIDHFKRVNDTFGHPVGDQVLVSFVEILNENCRTADCIARVGGEEFAILLPNTGSAGAFTVAENIRESVERFVFDGVGEVTVSLGVAELVPEDDLTRWYTRADTALYLAKNSGRNQTVTSDMLVQDDKQIEVMSWHVGFESGNAQIDLEHRALLRAGERLLEAFYRHDSAAESSRLHHLFELLGDHFASEERILHDAGYLDLVAHREIHKSLLASAHFWKSLQKNGRIQSPAFYGFLINKVIGDHLFHDDAKFFGLFRHHDNG